MSLFNFLSNSFNRFFVKKFTETLNQSSALPPLKAFILEPILTPSGIFESGTFTVDHTGLVSIDYLFDGGAYQGELAIFSLSGIEGLTPGSHEFIQEAAYRALTDSILGHIVIADSGDGARFDVSSGENWNAGEYLGIKSFAMNPDSEFGIMLVPNGHVQQIFDNPALEGDLRPLFSMVTANPNDGFHVGQIADVTGNGSTFVMEDLRMDLGTDRDYNDIIFQIRGAIGKAASIDNHIDPQVIDWRDTDMGKGLLDYIKPYDNSVVHPTYPLISSEPPDSQQPLVGIIDSYGFSPNNPDLNYQQIIAGSDRIDNDLNPYVPVYYPDTGTYLAGIVQATQNNEIGINGINDNAQMWFGRAGNDNWADSLIEFVNVTKNSHQTAVIQLNIDLSQVNIDGTVTTRYDLTPAELHALDYARQHNTIVVVPAGDNGSVISGLGQASQQFDNILTVGSAHRITDDPTVPIAQAYTRTDYSNYGLSLDIVADGGTIADPITSTVGNSTGTMAGTAVAAAQVVGALSLLWANNPDLDYRQVIKILKNTATDLNTLGWDKYTGAGLLNPKAAVGFAKVSPPEQYIDLPIDSPTPPPGYRDYIVQPGDSLIGITKNELHLDDSWTEIVKPDGSNFSSPNDNLPVGTVIYLPIKHEIGSGISVVTPPPAIPKMPPQLELHSDQSFYIQGEPVSLVGRGLAYDFNGASDVSKVELSLELLDGSTRHLKDFTGSDLKIDADGFIYFEYDLPLETLNKGVYTLKAIAYDQAGLTSDPILDSFAVISPPRFNPGNPSGFDPKIDPISYAIERAIDLTNYTTDQIADTRWWTVSLPPNLSPQAIKDLAASIGATYSENQESHIPDTFVWEFPPDLTPAEVVLRLEQLPQLQFFYPVITYRLEFPQLIVNSPLFPDQWNLDNSGQTGGMPGADANVLPVWADYGITGRNVTIGIVDDGVQYIHPNLIPNYLAALSYDFTQDWQYSYPNNQNYPHADYSDLALVDPDLPASNNLGAKRLVITPPPEVFLKRAIVAKGKPRTPPPPPRPVFLRRAIVTKGKRVAIVPPRPVFLRRADDGGLDSDDIFFYQASMHGTSAAGVALASNNGGMVGVAPNASFANLKLIQDSVVDNQIADSFGYESDDIDIYNNSWKPDVPFAILPSAVSALEIGATSGRGGLGNIYVFASGNDGLDGDNINYNGLANSRHAIAVAAIDDNGKSAWYSTPGAAILVSAPSSSNDPDGRTVGITTTDLVGEKGFDTSSYTHEFGGTSAAAPLVSGIIALMLEANPNLTQRDVQHILIEAARHNDPSDPEWDTNAAGYDVNYKYGFGAVDAKAAVEAAISWNSVDPEVRISSPVKLVNKPIPDYDPALVVDPDHPENAPNNPLFIPEPITIITITQDITVEWAEVMFDATHSSRGDLKVTLISPDGTESILAEPRYDAEDNYYKWVFTSNRNWGESSLGNWTLRVSDEIDGEVGTFNSWQLNLYGTAKPIPTDSWTKQLGTPSEDTSRHIAVDSDGNLYAVGYTLGSLDGNNLGSADAYLAKYDSLGNLQWKSQLGTANSDQAWGVAVDNGNNIYITGNTGFSVNAQGNSLGTNDAFIAKYDSNGNQLWNNLISSPYDDTARDIAVDSAGNAYITGMTWGNLAGNSSGQGDTWVAKYDNQGNQVWIEQSGTSGIDFSLGIARDIEGNIYTAGYTDGSFDGNTNAGSTDVFISKYNQNGEKLWTQQLGTTASEGYFDNSYGLGGGLASFERRFGIATDNTGNVYISGLTAGSLDGNTNAGGTDAFIAKYDKDGNKLWTQQLGTTGDDRSAAVAVDSNNNVYILGYTTGSLDGQQNLGGADTFVVKYDSNGNKLETKLFGTTADDVGGDIAIDHSDNIYFTGNTFGGLVGSNAGSIDAWIAKNEFIQIPATPQVTIVAADATASEGGNAGQFVVTRTGDTSQALTVKLAIAGDAKNGQDYSSLPGSIVIPVGATSVTIPVIAKADAVVEPDENVTVILAGGNNYDVGSDSSASVTIKDYTGNSQYGSFTYVNPANGHIYILSQPDTWLGAQAQAQALGGNLVTVNNAAEQNWLVNTFSPSKRYWIGLTDSPIYGANEGSFKWVDGEPLAYTNWDLGNPDNATPTPEGEDFVHMNFNYHTLGSWNDMPNDSGLIPGVIEIAPNTLNKPIVLIQASDNKAGEEGNAGQLVVSRIGDTTNPLTVKYSVAGNATNGTDYEQLSGTITIPAGAALVTIPIVPIADYQVEDTEKVIVNLTPDSAYTVSAQGTTTVDIANESPINLLYRQVLGRDADSNGLNYHTQLLQNGESIEQIRWEMAHDTLFGEAKDQITLMYQTLVGRAPLATEISYWQDRLGVDTTLSQVREFLSSTVADSIGEFSNVQGQNNWYYGYYEGSLASDNFQQMTEVKYGDWWVDNADYWTTLNSIGGHPNSVVGGITPVNQFPVRRWVSEVDGNINISGILAKTDTNFNVTSDGTIGHILVDGVEVWSQAISASDNVGVNYSINAAVQAGSVVDFVIDAKNNDGYDGTKFTATITTEPLIPQPTTSRIYTNPTTGHKYFLTAQDTWLGAEAQAETAGGNLVTINDAAESDWLFNTFGTSGWMGLTDSPIFGATEGNYKWVSGEPVTYTNWALGGQNNVLFTPEGEDFGERFGANGQWNDMPSEQAWIRRGIVEIPSTPTATNLNSTQIYTEGIALNLTDIVVTDPDGQATVTLTLSNPAAGSLTVGTSGSVTSSFNGTTGEWRASGAVANVNALLAGVQFVPAPNFNSNLTIATSVTDDIAAPVTGTITLHGTPVNFAPTVEIEPTRVWTRELGTGAWDVSTDVTTDSNGNVYMVGWTGGALDGNSYAGSGGRVGAVGDGYITKYDVAGNKLWTKVLGSSDDDTINGVAVDSVGNAYVVGFTVGNLDGYPNAGMPDAFFAKYDANGNRVWIQHLATANYDQLNKIVADNEGNFYAVGNLDSKGLVLKFDSDGNIIWTENDKLIGLGGQDVDFDPNTNSIYVGASGIGSVVGQSSLGGYESFVLRYDSNGNLVWSSQLSSPNNEQIESLDVDSNSNIYVSGYTNGTLPGATSLGGIDAFVAKIDSSGNNLWTHQLGTTGNDYGNGIKVDQNGNIIVTGQLEESPGAGTWDGFITEFDSNSNRANWTQSVASPSWDYLGQMAFDNNNNLYVAGGAHGSIDGQPYAGAYDAVLLKYQLTQTYTEDTALNLKDLVVRDADPEDAIAVTLTLSNSAAGTLSTGTAGAVTSSFNAATGTWSASGKVADVNALLAGVQLIPAQNFNGNLTVNASVTDGHSPAVTNTISLTGKAVNDAPTLGAIAPLSGAFQNEPFTITYANLLASSNAQDVENTPIVFRIDAVQSGTLTKNDQPVIPGVTTLSAGEKLVWTPSTAGAQISAFSVSASDGTLTSATPITAKVNVANAIPDDHWNSRFINLDATNFADDINYNFNAPDAVKDLGVSSVSNDGIIRLQKSFGSPAPGIQDDYFAMQAETTVQLTAGQDYVITTRSDDGTKFLIRKQGEQDWTEVGDDWRDRSTVAPAKDIYFQVPESGNYDFQILYYEKTSGAAVDVTMQPANPISSDTWIQQLGVANSWDSARGMAVDDLGNVYIAGHTQGSLDGNTNAGASDPFLTKYDVSGNKIWTKQIGSTGTDYYNNVLVDSYGDIYTVGYDDASGNYLGGVSIAKWDDSGNQIWQRFYDTATQDFANGIATDNEGNIYIAGMSDYAWTDPTNGARAFVAKYDSNGNRTWTTQIDTVGQDQARSVAVDSDGNVYIAGITEGSLDGTNAGNTDVFVAKYDVSGNQVWLHQLGSAGSEGATSLKGVGSFSRNVNITVDSDGSAYISGSTTGSLDGNVSAGNNDAFVAKYDTDGNKLWTRQVGTTADDVAMGVTVDSDGKVYIAGQTNGNLDGKTNFGDTDAFLTVFDSDGYKLTTQLLGTSQDDNALNVVVDRSGNVYLSGDTAGSLGATQAGGKDFWVAKNGFNIITVSNTNDSGAGSLRDAINQANSNPDLNKIIFNIPTTDPSYNPVTGGFTIRPNSVLPEITNPVIIDGTTQPGFSGTPIIELNGHNATPSGLNISAGNTTIQGLVINGFSRNIQLSSNGGNIIAGNFIGTDVTGTTTIGTQYTDANGETKTGASYMGIYINNSANNIIGGTTSINRNLIAGVGYGITISGSEATGNQIIGNYIGTDITGTQNFGNHVGIDINNNAANNIIGRTTPGTGNLVSGSIMAGISINGNSNQVVGNYIGTDITGTQDLGNSVGIAFTGINNVIGGVTPEARNLISGNDSIGVLVGGDWTRSGGNASDSGNQLIGNYIGTDITGTQALGNNIGVSITGSNYTVGGTAPGSGNLISGNSSYGISIERSKSNNQILGNLIGTDFTGTQNLGNGGSGIGVGGSNNIIGGTTPESRNVISGNDGDGITIGGTVIGNNVVQGNYIGTDITGTQALGNSGNGISISTMLGNNTVGGQDSGSGNTIAFNGSNGVSIGVYSSMPGVHIGNAILSNSIFSNTELEIDLAGMYSNADGLTANDLGDGDTGANGLQNYPVLSSAASDGSSTNIIGTLNSTPNTTFRLEFFSNPDDSRQGKTFLGYENVTTDSNGDASFDVAATAVATGSYITSTATDSNNNTSEFSAGVAVEFSTGVAVSRSWKPVLTSSGIRRL